MEESRGLDSVVQTGKEEDTDMVIVYCNRKRLHRRMHGAKCLQVVLERRYCSVKRDTRNIKEGGTSTGRRQKCNKMLVLNDFQV